MSTPDLRTDYMGLRLTHPIVASAGPLTGRVETLVALEAAGAAAVVLPSLFEEDVIEAAHRVQRLHSQPVSLEASTYLPDLGGPDPLERALALVAAAKACLHIPVIASLNGTSSGGWLRYGRHLVEAGADALEVNIYAVAANPYDRPGVIESHYLGVVASLGQQVDVPIAVKTSPFVSAMASFANDLVDAGANALVLFNRFVQPDIDLDTLDVTSTLHLSTSDDLRLPLRWIGVLHGIVDASLACSGGVHTAADATKAVLAGADVVMTTSALLRHGIGRIGELRDGLYDWLAAHDYESVAQARGSVSRDRALDPDAYERAQYVAALRRGRAGEWL